MQRSKKKFRHYWKPGPTNLGDYSTKHHAAAHHRTMRPTYLTPKKYLDLLRMKYQMAATAARTTKCFEHLTENPQQGCAKHGTWRQSPVPGDWDCGPIRGTSEPILGITRWTADRRSSARAYKQLLARQHHRRPSAGVKYDSII